MFLTKVVLGQVHNVSQFAEVNSCPSGSQSVSSSLPTENDKSLNSWWAQVVFDRINGQLNETVVYTNEAIRPVFLILFG